MHINIIFQKNLNKSETLISEETTPSQNINQSF